MPRTNLHDYQKVLKALELLYTSQQEDNWAFPADEYVHEKTAAKRQFLHLYALVQDRYQTPDREDPIDNKLFQQALNQVLTENKNISIDGTVSAWQERAANFIDRHSLTYNEVVLGLLNLCILAAVIGFPLAASGFDTVALDVLFGTLSLSFAFGSVGYICYSSTDPLARGIQNQVALRDYCEDILTSDTAPKSKVKHVPDAPYEGPDPLSGKDNTSGHPKNRPSL